MDEQFIALVTAALHEAGCNSTVWFDYEERLLIIESTPPIPIEVAQRAARLANQAFGKLIEPEEAREI